ncbi:MAG: hypothetical protein QMC83_05020 [Thermodesulfovibrionales bacterium]|nr:hypothetical protein [Thermodesulfovibrionales bacterium]
MNVSDLLILNLNFFSLEFLAFLRKRKELLLFLDFFAGIVFVWRIYQKEISKVKE